MSESVEHVKRITSQQADILKSHPHTTFNNINIIAPKLFLAPADLSCHYWVAVDNIMKQKHKKTFCLLNNFTIIILPNHLARTLKQIHSIPQSHFHSRKPQYIKTNVMRILCILWNIKKWENPKEMPVIGSVMGA